jgi:heat shock protein HslJ
MVFLSVGCGSAKLRGNSSLFHHKWILSELNNAPVQISNTDRDAFLEFSYNDRKVTGYGGCNSITGTFNAEGSAFSFSPLATTKMSCEDTEFENAFLTALSKVNKSE